MKKFGASVVYEFEFGEPLADYGVELTCLAPDETAASQIAAPLSIYLNDTATQLVPWYSDYLEDYELEAEGILQQAGERLNVDLQFSYIAKGLPALIRYLQLHGCRDIEYNFVQGLEVDF